jgi:hypothetical protein
MLRVSAEISNTDVDLQLVNGDSSDGSAVEFSNELMSFAAAVASRDEAVLADSRDKLRAASSAEALVDAAAVAGNFQRMVRIADSTGIPIDGARMEAARIAVDVLELRRFRTAEHSPQ